VKVSSKFVGTEGTIKQFLDSLYPVGRKLYAESKGGVLGRASEPRTHQLWGLKSAVSSHRGAGAEIKFGAFSPKIWHLVTADD